MRLHWTFPDLRQWCRSALPSLLVLAACTTDPEGEVMLGEGWPIIDHPAPGVSRPICSEGSLTFLSMAKLEKLVMPKCLFTEFAEWEVGTVAQYSREAPYLRVIYRGIAKFECARGQQVVPATDIKHGFICKKH